MNAYSDIHFNEEILIFFHYCSLDTFIKIIETSKIRLCNPYKMNDSKELCWFFDMFHKVMKDCISSIQDEGIKDKYTYFYDKSISDIYNENYVNKSAPHIACFSECGDILSQWRAYGDDGRGVSIGFDIKKLVEQGNNSLKFSYVCYDLNRQKEKMLEIIHENELFNPSKINIRRMKDFYIDALNLIDNILYESACYKNPAFSEEREGRLIFYTEERIYNVDDKSKKEIGISGPLFRSNGYDIISFFELDFSKVKNDLIDSIFIGPRSKVTEFDINLLLETNGYKKNGVIKIKKSGSTYR